MIKMIPCRIRGVALKGPFKRLNGLGFHRDRSEQCSGAKRSSFDLS